MSNPQKFIDAVRTFNGESIEEKRLDAIYAIIKDPTN